MGIKGLMKLLSDICPEAIKEGEVKNYFGRRIAIDANMSIYQFLISIRGTGMDLMDESGAITSHLQGLFYRTIKFMQLGLKPVYVFDGKPPEQKSIELKKRKERKQKAEEALEKAKAAGDEEERIKWSKRTVRVSREQQEECKKLLRLMGVPVVESPSEAESQCAELCKKGLVYGSGSEDMDTLTFGSTRLVRGLSMSESRQKKTQKPIREIDLDRALDGLGFDMKEFTDLCIMCGCDYVERIRLIGPKKAYALMQQCRSIEKVLAHIGKKKMKLVIPDDYMKNVEIARKLFRQPDVVPGEQLVDSLKWTAPDEKGVIQYLVNEKLFDEKRVTNGLAKLMEVRKKGSQRRIDQFFKMVKKPKKRKRKEKQKPKKKRKKRNY